MAGVRFVAQSSVISTGTTKKTVLQIVPPANQRVLVKEISISFNGLDPTDEAILVQAIRQSSAGTGGVALALVKENSADDETLQTTAQEDVDGSTQPTDVAVLKSEHVHPQGAWQWQAPFGGEMVVKGGERLGLAVTCPGPAVDCVARFVCEE